MDLELNYGVSILLGKAVEVHQIPPSTHLFICKITILSVNPFSPTQISHLMTEETFVKMFMKCYVDIQFNIAYLHFFFPKLDLKT